MHLLPAFSVLLLLTLTGCERDTSGLLPVPPNTDPVVFADAFGEGLDYQAFLGSKLDAISIDVTERFSGTASLKVTVPATGYAGGAFPTRFARDLSGYNALTFWAKSSVPTTLDIAGLGNDNTGTSLYEASWSGIPLTTSWSKVVVPIPLPEKLTSERGLFFYAEGPETPDGHFIWFDDVIFETVPGITNPRPFLPSRNVNAFVGASVAMVDTRVILEVNGTDRTIDFLPGYLTLSTDNDSVAVPTVGAVNVVGSGTARITGKLGEVDAVGAVTINAASPPTGPAPTPTHPQADVISLFSDTYADVNVDTWSAPWDRADLTDFDIEGNNVKGYTSLLFAGIEFTNPTLDVSGMTHFHMDVWIPQGSVFKVKLVDFGADGIFENEPDSSHELTFSPTTTPALVTGSWWSLDIPLSDFTDLTTKEHMAQLVISGNVGTVFVDNVYFHR